MARIAVYAGSFDPITVGHLDVIRRGALLYDTLVVAVGHNPAKRYLFDVERRCALVREVCEGVPNVQVEPFSGLLVHKARDLGASVILRGLRGAADFDTEYRYGLANRDLSGIETVFLLSAAELVYVSSSLVKEIGSHGGDVSRLVPPQVLHALRQVYGG
jgi:pantetheine-phosphate adenylyltransferase